MSVTVLGEVDAVVSEAGTSVTMGFQPRGLPAVRFARGCEGMPLPSPLPEHKEL